MSRIASVFSVVGSLSLTLALASACGGQSFSSHGGDGGSANGGSTYGGSTYGGSGQAGNQTAGTSHGGFASAGSGGSTPNDRCSAPAETGQCDAAFPRWYHDPATNQCFEFIWGGCGGNSNNYASLADCQAACGGVSPTACQAPSDCAITPIGCCGICDGPNVSAAQLVAYNKQYAGQFVCGLGVAKTLPGPNPPGGDAGIGAPVACAPCMAVPPGQGTLKYFVPDCVQGQCVVSDLRTSPLTACMTTAECRLRNGTGCCEGCGALEQYVAVRNDGSFEKQQCGGLELPCDACAPQPPANVLPYCNPSGHCDVVYELAAGG